jgi:hypothetical protein
MSGKGDCEPLPLNNDRVGQRPGKLLLCKDSRQQTRPAQPASCTAATPCCDNASFLKFLIFIYFFTIISNEAKMQHKDDSTEKSLSRSPRRFQRQDIRTNGVYCAEKSRAKGGKSDDQVSGIPPDTQELARAARHLPPAWGETATTWYPREKKSCSWPRKKSSHFLASQLLIEHINATREYRVCKAYRGEPPI